MLVFAILWPYGRVHVSLDLRNIGRGYFHTSERSFTLLFHCRDIYFQIVIIKTGFLSLIAKYQIVFTAISENFFRNSDRNDAT